MATPSNCNVSSTGTNYTVYLTGIPQNQNSARKLAEDFGQFGKIVDIEMSYNRNPEAASITYAQHKEAIAAMEWWNTLDKTTAARPSQSTPAGNNRGVKCDHCGKILASVGRRDLHVKYMHIETECDVCHETLESQSAYRKHFNDMHTDKKPKILNATTTQRLNNTSSMQVNDTNAVPFDKAIEKLMSMRVKYQSLKIRLHEHSHTISKAKKLSKKKQRRLKRQLKEKENMVVSKCAALETMEQNCISLQEEVTNLSRNAETNETELNVLRQNDQEKDAALVTLQRNNRQLQIENDQLVQNFRNEQMKVEMLLQTLSSTLHPFKH